MEQEQSAASGEVADTSQNQNQGAATLADLSPEQNAELNKLIARKEKEWEKKNKPVFEKAGEFERLQSQLREKEQAELSELEKLKNQVRELEGYKTKSDEYDASIKEELEELQERVPEERKSLVPVGLSNIELRKWFRLNEKIVFGTDTKSLSAPNGGKPPIKGQETIEDKAKQFLLERGVKEDNPLYKHQLDLTIKQMSANP